MKIETEVEIPAKVVKTPAKVKKVLRVTCDICDATVDLSKDNHYGSGMSKCSLCDRDICRTTKEGTYYQHTCYELDPDAIGDYPDKYCIRCFPLYIPARRRMEERHWQEEEKLNNKIKEESLAWQKSKK